MHDAIRGRTEGGNERQGAACSTKRVTADQRSKVIVQELCESRGGRPELSVLTSLLVSVDVKNY